MDGEERSTPPDSRRPGLLARIRPHLLDVTPLRRSPDLRRLVLAQSVSELGSQATLVAIPYQVFLITRSTVAVGLIALAELVPNLLLAAVGGSIADSVDRRRLTLFANAVFALLSAGLAANAALSSPRLAPLYVFAGASGAVFALSVASVRAWPARLVPSELLPAAFAIEGATWNANALAGPALAGLLIGVAGVESAYVLDAVSFVAAAAMIARMAPSPPTDRATRLAPIADGVRTVLRQRVVATILALDFTAMLCGMPLALLPALAGELGVGPGVLGLLYAAPAAGGLLATALSGASGRLRRPGWGVLVALGVWSAGILVVAIAGSPLLAWAGLAVAGAGNSLSAILGNAITQSVVPDDVRGRLAGIDHLVSTAGPALGNVESGIVASWIGVGPTIALGGALALGGIATLGAFGRELRAVRRPDTGDPHGRQAEPRRRS